jgi:hypothetical protein
MTGRLIRPSRVRSKSGSIDRSRTSEPAVAESDFVESPIERGSGGVVRATFAAPYVHSNCDVLLRPELSLGGLMTCFAGPLHTFVF